MQLDGTLENSRVFAYVLSIHTLDESVFVVCTLCSTICAICACYPSKSGCKFAHNAILQIRTHGPSAHSSSNKVIRESSPSGHIAQTMTPAFLAHT